MISGIPASQSVRGSLKRYTKFVVVGLSNAFVDVVVLNLLMILIPNHSRAMLVFDNTIAVVFAILNSYVLNRRFTFSDRMDGSLRERVLFFVQAILNIGLNDYILALCSTYLVFSRNMPLFVSSNASKALAMFLSSSLSYILLRYVVFRGSRKPG